MTKRALLPGEQEAWERACAEKRWVARASGPVWFRAWNWIPVPSAADLMSRTSADGVIFTGDTIAYRARSVRADGTPVVP